MLVVVKDVRNSAYLTRKGLNKETDPRVFNPELVRRPFAFSKEERLKSNIEIKQLFKQGRRFSQGPVSVRYLIKTFDEFRAPVQVAFSVPKRHIKQASDRQLIKRRLREAYRKQRFRLLKITFERKLNVKLLFLWSDRSILDYINIEESMSLLVDRLEKEL